MTNEFILILSLFISPNKDMTLIYDTNITNGTAVVDVKCGNSTNWTTGVVNRPNKKGTNTFYLNLSNPNYFPGCDGMGQMRVRVIR